jgi:hypothetical protein
MVVVRTGHSSPKRPQPRQVRGLGPVHGSMWGWGNGVSIHTVANSLRRGMFRLMFTRSLVADRRRPPGLAVMIDAPLLIQPPAQDLLSWPVRRSPRTTSSAPTWSGWRRLERSVSRRRIEPAACEVGRKANTCPVWRAGKAASQLASNFSTASSWRASACQKAAIETRRPA